MPRSREKYLWDIVHAVEAVELFTQSLTFENFLQSGLVQAAVERKIEIIGEALRQIEVHYPGSSSGLPDTRVAIGMRNYLAHGYFATDLQELWLTAKQNLPVLKKAVLAKVDSPGDFASDRSS